MFMMISICIMIIAWWTARHTENRKYPQDLIFADFIVSRLQIHTEFNTVQVVLCLRRRSFFWFVAVFVIILYIAVCLPNLTPTLFLTSRHPKVWQCLGVLAESAVSQDFISHYGALAFRKALWFPLFE